MASQLGFSEIEFSNNQNKASSSRRHRKNKTIKKKTRKDR